MNTNTTSSKNAVNYAQYAQYAQFANASHSGMANMNMNMNMKNSHKKQRQVTFSENTTYYDPSIRSSYQIKGGCYYYNQNGNDVNNDYGDITEMVDGNSQSSQGNVSALSGTMDNSSFVSFHFISNPLIVYIKNNLFIIRL